MTEVPVALIVFRRPDTTRRVLDAIQQARPSQLFVIADGPREGHPTDAEQCRATRDVIAEVGWDCDVRRNYADENMGCQRRVATGLDWVFDQVDRAIILEDDCVPDPSFFPFCAEMLDRYESETQVMTVSGNNFQPERRTKYSYYFSRYMHCWGWATWRRAWKHFDPAMRHWPTVQDDGWLNEIFERSRAVSYWTHILNQVYEKEVDSWAYVWQFDIWLRSGINILPEKNLVTNVGFGRNATNTTFSESERSEMTIHEMLPPYHHPPFIVRNRSADKYTEENYYSKGIVGEVKRKIKKYLN
jgi:hypothetical protein